METIIGLALVLTAGLGTGTMAWPIKKVKDLQFDQFLFVFMLVAVLLCPWIVTVLFVPDIASVVRVAGFKTLIISNSLSVCWGVANVLYMVSIVRIGAALSGAILSALGMAVGVIMPMILKGSGLFNAAPDVFSRIGVVILSGLVVIVAGIVLVILAGIGREKVLKQGPDKKASATGSFMSGLLLIVPSGILSAGLSLAFVYSQGPILSAVHEQGAGDLPANFAVWALGLIGGGLVNVGWFSYIMTKKKTWSVLLKRKTEIAYGIVGGLQFILSVVFMGKGMVLLGALGASVGFGIQQSMQVLGNQLIGFLGGEWKGIGGKPRRMMYAAIIVILLAVVILAISNVVSA